MRRKMLLITMTIIFAAALIGGATMAWFSYKVDVDNTFTAGTVNITAGDETVYPFHLNMDNVNPGDAFKKCIPIENTGTKNIRLSMLSEFEFAIDWGRVEQHFDELCFSSSEEWENFEELKSAVNAALAAGNVTNPADAEGAPNGPFDENGTLVIPIMFAPTATGEWFIKNVGGETIFFYDGILEPEEDTTLCIVVLFDGPWMGNLWQEATITLKGTFQAVQSSNDAPKAVWGEATWENYLAVKGLSPRDQLESYFSDDYVNYFYDQEGNFYYWYLCILNGNGNGGWFDETAWGGDTEGDGAAWWFYFDMTKAINEGYDTQSITAGRTIEAGEVTITVSDKVYITMVLFDDWRLREDEYGNVIEEPVKIKGYSYADLPNTRPASGQLDDYKGDSLSVEFPLPPYDVYLIHMDVEEYRLEP